MQLFRQDDIQPTQGSADVGGEPPFSGHVLISQDWLNEYGSNHPEFEVPDLSDHDFLRPDVTIEENFELMRAHVQKEREKVKEWQDHKYHPSKWHSGLSSRVWPFNLPLDARPQPKSYCPGPCKPANTAEGDKCLQCEYNLRECYNGPTKEGKCTTCQGAKSIKEHLKSLGKKDKASGQTRRCYWPQQEFFLNDFHSVKLFHKDCRWIESNTAEAKAEHAQDEGKKQAARAKKDARARKEEQKAQAAIARSRERARKAAETAMKQKQEATSATGQLYPLPRAPFSGTQTTSIGSAPLPRTVRAMSRSTGILDPVAQGLISASRRELPQEPTVSRAIESTKNNRGTKRTREIDVGELDIPAKRPRDEISAVALSPCGDSMLSASENSQGLAVTGPVHATPLPDDHLETQYDLLEKRRDQYYLAGDYMEAAQIQAAINVAGADRALAWRLIEDRSSRAIMENRHVMLAAWSGETLEGMVEKLDAIRVTYDRDQVKVTDQDRVLALRLQTALNVSLGGRYSAPAAFFVRDSGFLREMERLALAEQEGGPFNAHRPLTTVEIASILYHASSIRDRVFRSHVRRVLEPFGIPEGVWSEDITQVVPDHIARILEALVYYAPRG